MNCTASASACGKRLINTHPFDCIWNLREGSLLYHLLSGDESRLIYARLGCERNE